MKEAPGSIFQATVPNVSLVDGGVVIESLRFLVT
jgi:hypothetical protein